MRGVLNPELANDKVRMRPPLYKTMLNMYRMSRRLIHTLEKWYHDNDDRWTFFETMISMVVHTSSTLTSASWNTNHSFPGKLIYRPCFTAFEKPGIYHPVKVDAKGQFFPCEKWRRWTDEEHQQFTDLMAVHGKSWSKIAAHMVNRSETQVRSHAEKHFAKEGKEQEEAAAQKKSQKKFQKKSQKKLRKKSWMFQMKSWMFQKKSQKKSQMFQKKSQH